MLIYVLRSIKSSGARSLLITMSIMISAMVLLLNFTINQDVLQQYKNIHKETYQDFDILIKGKEPYFSSITYPTEMVSERIDIVYYTVENKKVENSYFKLLGTDIDSLVAESLITSDTKLDKNSVVMSSEAANYYGLNVGDSIKLSDGKNQFELKLTSIVANEGLMKISSNFPLIILDIERLRELTNLNSNQNSAVLLNVNNDNDITKVEKNIKNNNENLVVQNLVSNAEIRNNVTMIRTILLVILFIVILLNIYIIISNSKVLLEKRSYTFGIFRSLGATKGKVIRMLLLENIIYGLSGSILGVCIGLFFRQPIVYVFTGSVGKFSNGNIPISYIIFTIIFSIGLQIACTIGHVFLNSNKSLRSLLLDKINSAQEISNIKTISGVIFIILSIILHFINNTYNFLYSSISFVSIIIAVILLLPCVLRLFSKLIEIIIEKFGSYSVGLGVRNLGFSKYACSNVILVTVTLTIVLSIFMLSNSLTKLLNGSTSHFNGEIRITGLSDKATKYDFLKENEYVGSIEPSYSLSDSIKIKNDNKSIVIVGLEEEKNGIINVSGRLITDLRDDEVLVDEYYATRFGIALGDKITLNNADFKKDQLELKVVGFVNSASFSTTRNILVVSTSNFINNISSIPSVLNVTITSSDVDLAKESIQHDLSQYDVTIQTVHQFLQIQQDNISGIVNMVWLILLLSILLAVVGVVNNTFLGFIQRKQEYAVLLSTSMSKAQVKLMLFSEVMFTVLLSCIFAVSITPWVTIVLTDLLYSIGICVDISIDLRYMFVVSLIVFLALLSTLVVPLVNLNKMKLIDELKRD